MTPTFRATLIRPIHLQCYFGVTGPRKKLCWTGGDMYDEKCFFLWWDVMTGVKAYL